SLAHKHQRIVQNLPKVDIGLVECPEPAIFEDSNPPSGGQLTTLAGEVFVDHRVDRERAEDREGIKSDRLDLACDRLRECIRAKNLGNPTCCGGRTCDHQQVTTGCRFRFDLKCHSSSYGCSFIETMLGVVSFGPAWIFF